MAIYFVTFEYCGEICHTTGEANFPSAEDYYSENYSKKAAYEMAEAFVYGYLDVKNPHSKEKPHNIRYTIKFPAN